MKVYNSCIYFIFFVKIIYLLTNLAVKYFKHIEQNDKQKKYAGLISSLEYWSERTEFVFIISMSVLLMFLFNPWHVRVPSIDKETRTLLFLYGFIIIFTADWGLFFKQSVWLSFFGKKNNNTSVTSNSNNSNNTPSISIHHSNSNTSQNSNSNTNSNNTVYPYSDKASEYISSYYYYSNKNSYPVNNNHTTHPTHSQSDL
jgi:hypothetical protein